ncbi:helicase SNF [Virgibacillus profundi]|uniref:Helicase SNF n=1 Tax=Virgibacillus profundi TaxID=2024555 RepID=A0A2A2IK20_9BACI|nr:DEAD/DEAH box helicase [Virgibacillus profundi]PAV31656.1 helicase SNF [Virgibacillus profundi]PXY55842.1 helicase SNF [Virgibacillus profundi]
MKIKLSHKKIKEMCGSVSYKRGESFYHSNKVIVEKYSPNRCEATVKGKEDFHVTIDKETDGSFSTSCSCPKLASYKNDCQHIAAVLSLIYDKQRKQEVSGENPKLTKDLLTLFNDQSKRSSGHQLHFEDREVLDVVFTCKPFMLGKELHMLGLEMEVNSTIVWDVREFLEQVKVGKPSVLTDRFTYDPNLHCFSKETNATIGQLIKVAHDEKVYMDALQDKPNYINDHSLFIPPSSWEQLAPLLEQTPMVKLEYGGNTFDGLIFSNETLPLQFSFEAANNGHGYQLKVKGLNQVVVLNSYQSVLSGGKIHELENEDCKRLSDLKQMLEGSKINQVPIPKEQLDYFLDNVAKGLKKLGDVQLSGEISKSFIKTPLIAKLYLDRVNNRLLAGLEFHYENSLINPLESQESKAYSKLIRDMEKEEEILELMETGSFAKTEGGYFLHNEELEYQFLYHIVPKLQKLVQIYATTAVRTRILKKSIFPKIRVKVKKERTNWLEFKFEMDGIPEKQIKEVLLAIEEKRKFYRLQSGSLLSLETREFEEIRRFLNAVPAQDENLEEGLNVPIVRGIRLLETVNDHNLLTFEESFRHFLDNIQHPDKMEFEVPGSLEHILRDYQKQGFQWMKTLAAYKFGGILADDMGLGKTLQSIAFIHSELKDIRKRKLPVLIVCPSSLTYNWLNEIKKFTPDIRAAIVDGNKTDRIHLQKEVMGMDVVITSYPLLRKDIKWFEKQYFHTVFFDEAQVFKNPITQTARAVKRIEADYRFALTGTPVENALEELWSIFHVVFPELFQGLKEYSNLTRDKIARRIRPFLLRRLKKNVLSELPEKIETMESVELLKDQKELYAAYLAKLKYDTLKHLDKDTFQKNKIRILAGLTRLRQICCHPALFVDGYKGSSAKFEQLLEIIEESKLSGRRVLIFSQFTGMLEIIGRELTIQGDNYFYLDGQTPSEERVEICNRFNEGERDLFLISLKAGGTGLNLTGADTVILYDLWWNPAVEEQAADRAHRIGQKNVVQVIKLISRGTIEGKINELQEKKRHLIEEIIDPAEKANTSLNEEDIREILTLE